MYAPKFRSWMTDEERFMESLSFKLDRWAEEAHAEIQKMAKEAMPKPVKMDEQQIRNDLFRRLLNSVNDIDLRMLGMAQGHSDSDYWSQFKWSAPQSQQDWAYKLLG